MFFYILSAIFTLWATVYSVSYGIALFKNKNTAGGAFLLLLSLLAVFLLINHIFKIFLI